MNPLISKARRPKFDLTLKIIDLNNVPLVTGTSYVKWHLPSSTAAEHRGRTDKSPIKEHKVSWDYVRDLPVRLTIDKSNNLTETLIHFEVVQEFHGIGIKGERVTLGVMGLNLAEYVEESEAPVAGGDEPGVVRRYLMQDSKINSTLKIGICMKQVDGERNFTAPALKTAPVFGGIAGIVVGDVGENDNVGNLPSMSKTRDYGDHGDTQDMYRRALAASWAAQASELPADQCIEDIFNGGNGWKEDYASSSSSTLNTIPITNSASSSSPRIGQEGSEDHQHGHHQQRSRNHHRSQSGNSDKSSSTLTMTSLKASSSQASSNSNSGSQRSKHGHGEHVHGHGHGHKKNNSRDTLSMGKAAGIGPQHMQTDSTFYEDEDRGRSGGTKRAHEVDELDVREDLISWRLPGTTAVS